MLNHDFLQRKIKLLQEDLHELSKYRALTYADFKRNTQIGLAVERLLEQVVTRAIDINQHIIAELGSGKEKVRTYEDGFLVLADLEVYPKRFAEVIAPSAGLRNILVHEYDEIDSRLVHASIEKACEQYAKYCHYILVLIDKK